MIKHKGFNPISKAKVQSSHELGKRPATEVAEEQAQAITDLFYAQQFLLAPAQASTT